LSEVLNQLSEFVFIGHRANAISSGTATGQGKKKGAMVGQLYAAEAVPSRHEQKRIDRANVVRLL